MGRFLLLIIVFALFLLPSCDIINPAEEIPSYVAVDTVRIVTDAATEGSRSHNISDNWLYVNGKLIGVFEVPFSVPVLETGFQNIQIEPGIKNSGGDADRDIYPMMYGYYVDTFLVAGQILTLSPIFTYRPATFDLIEDFEDIGISFGISTESDTNINLVNNSNSLEGNSMYFCVDDTRPNFECRSTDLFDITRDGPAYLEIDFKSNDYFSFGLFSREYNGVSLSEVRIPVYTFNPTNEWKKVYIDLSYFVNQSEGMDFRLFFTCVRQENPTAEKTEVYIDNIKLISLPSK